MEDHMKDSISMIRNMDLELLYGQINANMLDIGKMEDSMEEDSIFYQMGNRKLESGVRAKRLDGLMIKKIRRI